MSFIDKVTITLEAGKGGDGKRSFRHERYISRGGPDGGDGGDGGNIIFRANTNQNTLAAFRYQKLLKSDDGLQVAPVVNTVKPARTQLSMYHLVPKSVMIED